VYLGVAGSSVVFNGNETQVNAEEIYAALCNAGLDEDAVYDCPNPKLMKQKRCFKFGLATSVLKWNVRLNEQEVIDYIERKVMLWNPMRHFYKDG
jgi:hypothetical protein